MYSSSSHLMPWQRWAYSALLYTQINPRQTPPAEHRHTQGKEGGGGGINSGWVKVKGCIKPAGERGEDERAERTINAEPLWLYTILNWARGDVAACAAAALTQHGLHM